MPRTLADALVRWGLHDGRGQAVSTDALRIQCPDCEQFITIAEAQAKMRDGMTVYLCPHDQQEFAYLRGEREFGVHGACEARHDGIWRPWPGDRDDNTP